MKNQTCCFSGHRKIQENKIEQIQKHLEEEIVNLINQGVVNFMAGGALGFDTMAAITVLRLMKTYPRIRLKLILPHWGQADKWSAKDKEKYALIRVQADEVTYTSWFYYNGCMQKRNRHMVNNSNYCICFLEKEAGGTAYTVNYAKQKGLNIINLAEIQN